MSDAPSSERDLPADPRATESGVSTLQPLFDLMDAADEALDNETYEQHRRQQFDAPDDLEYQVTVGTIRKINRVFEAIERLRKSDAFVIQALVDRFLAWPLPESVCSDLCVTTQLPGRGGTNLLTADEARQMFEYLFAHAIAKAEGVAAGQVVTSDEAEPASKSNHPAVATRKEGRE